MSEFRWDYPSLWAYLWEDRGRRVRWGVGGILWSFAWFIWWADDGWWWQAAFIVLALWNLAAVLLVVRTYYRTVKPHAEWRQRLNDGVVIPWELGDAMRVTFPKETDGRDPASEGPGAGPEADGADEA